MPNCLGRRLPRAAPPDRPGGVRHLLPVSGRNERLKGASLPRAIAWPPRTTWARPNPRWICRATPGLGPPQGPPFGFSCQAWLPTSRKSRRIKGTLGENEFAMPGSPRLLGHIFEGSESDSPVTSSPPPRLRAAQEGLQLSREPTQGRYVFSPGSLARTGVIFR